MGGKGLEAEPEGKAHIPRQRHHVWRSQDSGRWGRGYLEFLGTSSIQHREGALGLKGSLPVKMPAGAVGGEDEEGETD